MQDRFFKKTASPEELRNIEYINKLKELLYAYTRKLFANRFLDEPLHLTLEKINSFEYLNKFIQELMAKVDLPEEEKQFETEALLKILKSTMDSLEAAKKLPNPEEAMRAKWSEIEKNRCRPKLKRIDTLKNNVPRAKPYLKDLFMYFLYLADFLQQQTNCDNVIIHMLGRAYVEYLNAAGNYKQLSKAGEAFQKTLEVFFDIAIANKTLVDKMKQLRARSYTLYKKGPDQDERDPLDEIKRMWRTFIQEELKIPDPYNLLVKQYSQSHFSLLPRDVRNHLASFLNTSDLAALSLVNREMADATRIVRETTKVVVQEQWPTIKTPLELVVKAQLVRSGRGEGLTLTQQELADYLSIANPTCHFWPQGDAEVVGCTRMEANFIKHFKEKRTGNTLLPDCPASNWLMFAVRNNFYLLAEVCLRAAPPVAIPNSDNVLFLDIFLSQPSEICDLFDTLFNIPLLVNTPENMQQLLASNRFDLMQKLAHRYPELTPHFLKNCYSRKEIETRWAALGLENLTPQNIIDLMQHYVQQHSRDPMRNLLAEAYLHDTCSFLLANVSPLASQEPPHGYIPVLLAIALNDAEQLKVLLEEKGYAEYCKKPCAPTPFTFLNTGYDVFYPIHLAISSQASPEIIDLLKKHGATEDVECHRLHNGKPINSVTMPEYKAKPWANLKR